MATCSKCHRQIGCSCNLKNGVCGSCLGPTVSIQPQRPIPITPPQGQRINPKPRYNPPVVNKAHWSK